MALSRRPQVCVHYYNLNAYLNDSIVGCVRKQETNNVFTSPFQKRWASKASGGKSKNGRDSNPKYLGLKKGSGQYVLPGNILVRQRGTKFHPGDGVGIGRDHTLFSKQHGYVKFQQKRIVLGHSKRLVVRKYISVVEEKAPTIKQDIR